jgi:diketogulonate reductase-like aldo/keto reductase
MEFVTLRNGVKMPVLGYGVCQVTQEDRRVFEEAAYRLH